MTEDDRSERASAPPGAAAKRASEEIDALIQAYVDDVLTGAALARAETLLETSEQARQVHARLQREKAALRMLFENETARMAAARRIVIGAARRAASTDNRRARTRSRLGGRLLAPVALAAGLALGFFLQDLAPKPAQSAPGWRMSAAIYQRLYTAETFASAPVSEEAQRSGLRRVAEALDMDLSAFEAPEGLTLKRAQVLSFNGAPLGQLAFVDENDVAISLCLFRRASPGTVEDGAPRTGELLDMATVDWRSERHAFLLIGAGDAPQMSRLGAIFAQQLG